MRLYKRGKHWVADLRSYGLGRQSTGLTEKRAAEDLVVKLLASRGATPAARKQISLEALIKKYLAHSKTNKTELSHYRDKGTMAVFFEHCGDIPASEVTPETIERFKSEMSLSVKPATVNRNLNNIQSLFSRAVEWGYVEKSPLSYIKKMRVPETLPKFYTEKEIEAILEASPDQFRKIWLLFLYTGMRRGEVLNLKWTDIRRGKIHIDNPKEGKEKIVPLSKDLKRILKDMKNGQGRVVPLEKSYLTRSFKKFADRAGIGGNLHRLRHTVATNLLEKGVTIRKVAGLLGHSSISTTYRYTKALESEIAESVEKLKW